GPTFPPARRYLMLQPNDETDDETLVADALSGREEALEALLRRYERKVFNVALRMLGHSEDARDAAQSTFLKVFQGLRTYDPAYPFQGWILRIAVNEAINLRSRRKDGDPLEESVPSSERAPAERLHELDARRRIRRALRT